MATYRKVGKRWRAEVYVKGHRASSYFPRKAEAVVWAERKEKQLRGGFVETDKTLSDALDKYAAEVSVNHKGERWERVRISAIKRHPMTYKRVSAVTPTDIAEWRDERLQDVTGATVRREMGLLRSVFDVARREWRWIESNPMDDVKKPPSPPPRDRVLTEDEISALSAKLTGQYRDIFLLALETGMRLGEICGIRSEHIHDKYVVLVDTKNGMSRNVPLSPKARDLVREFSTTPANASAVFYKAKTALNLDCTFHDTRHTACVNLAKKLHILELARMLGMRDTKTLMIYYSESAESIADKLG